MAEEEQKTNDRTIDKEMMDRLIIIHNTIKNGGDSRPESLALLCNASKITIYRDIKTLKELSNNSLDFDRTKKQYFYKDKNFELTNNSISADEVFALAKAKILLSNLSKDTAIYKEISNVLDFIVDKQMLGSSNLINRIIEIQHPHEKIVNINIWQTIITAITENRILQIKRVYYFNNLPKVSKWFEDFYPYQLIFDEGSYYLWGKRKWDDSTITINSELINLNNIVEAKISNESFNLPDDFSYENRPKINYTIKLYNNAINENIEFADDQKIVSEDSQSKTIEFTTSRNEEYVLKWIMSHGSNIEPLEPESLVVPWEIEINLLMKRTGIHYDWLFSNKQEAEEVYKNRKNILQPRIDKRNEKLHAEKKDSHKNQIYDYIARLVRARKRLSFEYIKIMSSRDMMNCANELLPMIPRYDFFWVAKKRQVIDENNMISISTAGKIVDYVRNNY
nr:WYL domain-containing protein [uncultured Treponema sp.]